MINLVSLSSPFTNKCATARLHCFLNLNFKIRTSSFSCQKILADDVISWTELLSNLTDLEADNAPTSRKFSSCSVAWRYPSSKVIVICKYRKLFRSSARFHPTHWITLKNDFWSTRFHTCYLYRKMTNSWPYFFLNNVGEVRFRSPSVSEFSGRRDPIFRFFREIENIFSALIWLD